MIARGTAEGNGDVRSWRYHRARMDGWRTVAFALLSAAARTLDRAGRATMSVAAGVLRVEDLQGAIARTWDNFGRSDTLILSGLMPWERALYERFLEPDDHILIVGCGTGRDVIALLELGYRVEGLDLSADAVALGRRALERQGLSAELHVGAVESVPLPGRFDAFVFSWFCYGYIPQAATRIEVLRTLKAHAKPGGRVFVFYNPAERPPRALPIGLARFVARLTRSDWRPERGDVVGAVAGTRRAVHFEHQFWEGEIEAEARAAGLAFVHHERGEVGAAVLKT
jgi:SAM-dependent methyltransferase